MGTVYREGMGRERENIGVWGSTAWVTHAVEEVVKLFTCSYSVMEGVLGGMGDKDIKSINTEGLNFNMKPQSCHGAWCTSLLSCTGIGPG